MAIYTRLGSESVVLRANWGNTCVVCDAAQHSFSMLGLCSTCNGLWSVYDILNSLVNSLMTGEASNSRYEFCSFIINFVATS